MTTVKRRARVLVFTGDGKGKTTAALGIMLRAMGHGIPALMIQFIKKCPGTGELRALRRFPRAEVEQHGLGFLSLRSARSLAAHRAAAQVGLRRAEEVLAAGKHKLVVLDEICFAVAAGLLDEAQVIRVVRRARPDVCVVLTGRGATKGLIALADTVTEMRCVKHGLEVGFKAQKGVEL